MGQLANQVAVDLTLRKSEIERSKDAVKAACSADKFAGASTGGEECCCCG